MKVRDFWSSLPNSDQMRNKIKLFKEIKRREKTISGFDSCEACGLQLKFVQAADLMRFDLCDIEGCDSCGQAQPDRRFLLN